MEPLQDMNLSITYYNLHCCMKKCTSWDHFHLIHRLCINQDLNKSFQYHQLYKLSNSIHQRMKLNKCIPFHQYQNTFQHTLEQYLNIFHQLQHNALEYLRNRKNLKHRYDYLCQLYNMLLYLSMPYFHSHKS